MTDDAWWGVWSRVDDFVGLDRVVRGRLAELGIPAAVLTVEDAGGDLHVIGTSADWPDARSREGGGAPPAGWASATLYVGPRRVGVLHFDDSGREIDDQTWRDVVGQIAVAVDLVAARFGRRRLRQGLETMHDLGMSFASALAGGSVALVAVAAARKVLGASASLVYGLADECLMLLADDGYADGSTEKWHTLALDVEAPATEVVRLLAPVVLESRKQIEARYPNLHNSEAIIAWPLRIEHRVLGALCVAYDSPRSFTPDDLRMAGIIADQASQALERVRLTGDLDRVRFASALDAMLDLVTIQTAVRGADGSVVDFVIDYMNPVQIDVAQRPRDAIIGQRLSAVYPAAMGTALFDRYVAVVETGDPFVLEEMEYEDVIDGDVVSGSYALQVTKFGDGIILASRDVSQLVKTRKELLLANEQLSAAQRLAKMGTWRIDLSSGEIEFSDELRRLFELPEGTPVPDLPAALVQLIHPDDRSKLEVLIKGVPETGEPFTVEVRIQRPSGVGVILASGGVTYDDVGQPLHLWGTAQDVSEQRLTEHLLTDTAAQLEREHATVAMLQEAFAPTLPEVEWAEIAGLHLASGPDTDVGGDWYDAVVLPDSCLGLTVGDVAGHGIDAVALMAQLRNALRACAVHGATPAATLATANRLLGQQRDDRLSTAFVASLSETDHRLTWASAGHMPFLIIDEDGAEFVVGQQNPPLGAITDHVFVEQSMTLGRGRVVLVYTDGLVERRGEIIDVGLERLRVTAARLPKQDLAEFCEELCGAMFTDQRRSDDVCLLALRLP